VTPKVHVAWRNYIYLKTKKLELVAILALLFDRVKRTLHLLGQKAQSGFVSFRRQIFRLALRRASKAGCSNRRANRRAKVKVVKTGVRSITPLSRPLAQETGKHDQVTPTT